MKMDTRVYDDLTALSRAAFAELLSVMRDAVKRRGRFSVALSGGQTPAALYGLWAGAKNHGLSTPWDRVHLFWSDERCVPRDSALSNYRMTHETLISLVPIPEANVHPMPVDSPQAEKSAEAYEVELRKFFGSSPPAFDLQLLGLGVEGHTASLFPGSPALEEKQRWVVAVEVPAKPPRRLTLTLPVLNHGRNTFFLAAGADKREIISDLRREPESTFSQYPAGRVRPAGPVLWFLDKPAAGQ